MIVVFSMVNANMPTPIQFRDVAVENSEKPLKRSIHELETMLIKSSKSMAFDMLAHKNMEIKFEAVWTQEDHVMENGEPPIEFRLQELNDK